jgi:hypothetical protein
MNKFPRQLDTAADTTLKSMIEPLASYVCAADRPRAVLLSALSALFDEVEATNRTALMNLSGLRADSLGLAS